MPPVCKTLDAIEMAKRPPNEWEFQGEVLGWLNGEIARRPGLKLDRATQEPSRVTLKRNDLIVWWDRAAEVALLTVELKRPNTPIADLSFFADADAKAKRWSAPFFAIWNIQSAELYTNPPDRRATLADRIRSITIEVPITRGDEWLHRDVSERLQSVAVELLDCAWNRYHSKDTPTKIDAAVFVERMAIRVAQIRAGIETDTRALAARNRHVRRRLNEIAAEQGFINFVDDIDAAVAGQYAYRLVGQIVFYFALRRKQPALPPLELPEGHVVPTDLRPYWDDVRRFDYEALFQPHELDTLLPVPASSQVAVRQFIEELTTYDWADLREDVLGAVFEQLIPREEQILLGQFYTPFPVADVLVAMCVDPSRPVLDPACGSGTFLMRAYDYICDRTAASHSQILERLWGFDLSPFAAELAAINLFRKDLAEFDNFPRIVPGNYFERMVGEQTWFPPARLGGQEKVVVPIPSFSAVIGNPPYLRSQNQDDLNPSYKGTLFHAAARNGVNAEAKTDLFAFFIYESLHFLAPGGRLGFVVSASWLTAHFGRTLQKLLLERFNLTVIASAAESFFSTVDVNTVLVVAEHVRPAERSDILRFAILKRPLKRFSDSPCTAWARRGTSACTNAGGPMQAYSMDLRERALLDSDAGMKAADVAVKYRVSGSWVRLLKQRRRETGEVAPRVQRHGRRRMLEPHLHTLAALIAE